MKRRINLCLASAPLLVVVAVDVAAAMRCGTELIDAGEPALRVLEACGKPDTGNAAFTDYGEWVYNFGPQSFMYKVIISQDRVERIETLGRGFAGDAPEVEIDTDVDVDVIE